MIEIKYHDNGTFSCIETEAAEKVEKKIKNKTKKPPQSVKKYTEAEERQVDSHFPPKE